jgi:hypothetical protein
MFSDPDTWKRVSAVRSKYTKGPFYTVTRVSPGEGHLFSMRDEEKRKALKGKMGPAVRLHVEAFDQVSAAAC